jgi:hypothetical protein
MSKGKRLGLPLGATTWVADIPDVTLLPGVADGPAGAIVSITVPAERARATYELTVWILTPEGRSNTDFHVIR